MTSEFYFFDQFSCSPHAGSIRRSKRDLKDFNQALYHVKIASALENDDSNPTENHLPILIKKQTGNEHPQTVLHQLNKPMLPEILTKELDEILQIYNNKSRSTSPSSPEEQINPTSNLPKVSLPGSLILQLHSTWFDLIKNTNYKYKIWRTKAGEEAWHQYIRQKHSQQLNPEKQQEILVVPCRTSSRVSNSSIKSLSRRQSSAANSKGRTSRSFSRASFMTASNILQDNLRLVKSIRQGTPENVVEPIIKNGLHVEFKFSIQNDQIKQNIVLFDVPKADVHLDEDVIAGIQNKCQRLLAETKQKILETIEDQNKKHSKICRVWFYEDNQYIRNKNNIAALNELNRRQKSKFALSILRHEIPEKYNIDIDIPETKHKCYIELPDGSTQIYYPSGRLAVVRFRPTFSTTLFFDDTDSPTNQFLGLVTSTGNVILMQPTFYARFITNNQHKNAYLCNGKTGIIEKQFQCYLPNNCQRQSVLIDEDNINPPLIENTVQLQINSFMQLEYHNPSNIIFAFTCQNEAFKFQLGIPLPTQSSTLMNLTTKTMSTENKWQSITKRSSLIKSNYISKILEKKQIQTEKLADEQSQSRQLSFMHELIQLRKQIQHICHSWLQECRTTLGIMNIDAYCLPDLPPQPIVTQTNDINRSKNAIQLDPRTSLNNKFVTSIDRQQFLTGKFESNVIANAVEQFVPHSDTGRAIKQGIYTKKILPIIK